MFRKEQTLPRSRSAAILQIRTFHALRYRDFRLLWSAQFAHSLSLWIEGVARSWLVYEMTGSPFLLGLVQVFRATPLLLFGLLAGVMADRVDKRRLLIYTSIATMLLKFSLALLITFGAVQVWHVYVNGFLMGISMAFAQPVRSSMVPELVDKENLMNGVSLNQAAMNITRVFGPALAGILISFIGVGGVYYVSGGIYLVVIVTTALLRTRPVASRAKRDSVVRNLKEGFRFAAGNALVLAILAIILGPLTFGWAYMTLMPIFADQVLKVGSSGLGLLTSAAGFGSVTGAATMATLGNVRRKGWVILAGILLFEVGLLGFALSTLFPLSLMMLFLLGMGNSVARAVANTVLFHLTPEAFYGRITSMFTMDQALQPFAVTIAGTIAEFTSAPLAVTILALIGIIFILIVGSTAPQLRRLD